MTARRLLQNGPHGFPLYSLAERRADLAVHLLGVAGALAGGGWLLLGPGLAQEAGTQLALLVYVLGLLGGLGASAAYNLAPIGRGKELLRRLDHAMIYLLIAASYTPFAFLRIAPPLGPGLGLGVWAAALAGVVLKLRFPRRWERLGLALYLAMGWALLPAIGPLVEAVEARTLWLLIGGGLVYTAGTLFHAWRRLPFHNAIWHALVLAAAALHFLAVALEIALEIALRP